jgi:outer membrane protein assembly factor BamB
MPIHTFCAFLLCAGLFAQPALLMNRYDPAATGANLQESVLNPANVKAATFGKLYSYYVDGAVFAQPLYVPSMQIPGRGAHNILYVATMNDRVYAFDADRPGAPLWMRNLTDEMAGITPVPVTDITNNADLNVVGNVGILGTPVIDRAAGAIFLVARTRENGKYFQRLYKLSLATGADRLPPVIITATVKGTAKDAVNGQLTFDPKGGNQRPGLVLVKGKVIVAWASHEDIRPYHGWIMAYDAATLKQSGVLCLSPDGMEGGVWQSGRGPAVDADGSIYFEVGNGSFNGTTDFGTSLLKLSVRENALAVDDYFTPHDYEALNARDADLGSTGPLLVPGTNLLVAGSKKGILYLFDTRKLGKLTPNDSGALQAFENNGGRLLAGPAFWDGPGGRTLYVWCEADFLKAYRFEGDRLATTPYAKGAAGSRGSPGGSLTVSADGKKAGTGIVWGTLTVSRSADHGNAAGVLRAFDAESLEELWNSEQQPKRDRLGTLVKFNPPTVIGGRVYVPNYDNAVNVYGLLAK